jgi:pimeloyl-ACP methyl ester carboxylesterase
MSKRVAAVIEITAITLFAILAMLWAWTQIHWIGFFCCVCATVVLGPRIFRRRASGLSRDDGTMSGELLQIHRCASPQRAGDIVFVHGLNGDARLYWCHDGKPENCWPAWLGEDIPDVGVWSLGYENAAFVPRRFTLLRRMGLRGFAMPLTDRAKNVLLRLALHRIGERPLVFITHSMGGLLVKQLLHTANDSTNPEW